MPAHPGHDLPSYRKGGNRLNARQHNNMAAMAGALQRLQLGDGLGGEITPSGLRLYLTGKQKPIVPEAAAGARIRAAQVRSAGGLYVTAYFFAEDFSGAPVQENVFIAKPPRLRIPNSTLYTNSHDGITFQRINDDERRATKGTRREVQITTPRYRLGDFILVIETGDIGVSYYDSNPNAHCKWMDLNIDGRQFQVTDVEHT